MWSRGERALCKGDHTLLVRRRTGATFCITLGFHVASLVCLFPLVWLVPQVARRRAKSRPLATLADTEVERAE